MISDSHTGSNAANEQQTTATTEEGARGQQDASTQAASSSKPRKQQPEPRRRVMSDAFMMKCYKIRLCKRQDPHNWRLCPYAHPGEAGRRRPPHTYQAVMCDFTKSKECSHGDACPLARNALEYWLHPDKYRTTLCGRGESCNRNICFFAHNEQELRTVDSQDANLAAAAQADAVSAAAMLDSLTLAGSGSSSSQQQQSLQQQQQQQQQDVGYPLQAIAGPSSIATGSADPASRSRPTSIQATQQQLLVSPGAALRVQQYDQEFAFETSAAAAAAAAAAGVGSSTHTQLQLQAAVAGQLASPGSIAALPAAAAGASAYLDPQLGHTSPGSLPVHAICPAFSNLQSPQVALASPTPAPPVAPQQLPAQAQYRQGMLATQQQVAPLIMSGSIPLWRVPHPAPGSMQGSMVSPGQAPGMVPPQAPLAQPYAVPQMQLPYAVPQMQLPAPPASTARGVPAGPVWTPAGPYGYAYAPAGRPMMVPYGGYWQTPYWQQAGPTLPPQQPLLYPQQAAQMLEAMPANPSDSVHGQPGSATGSGAGGTR